MANVVVSGAGMNGLTMALLLAKDGHSVTVIERDPAPPPQAAMRHGTPGSAGA